MSGRIKSKVVNATLANKEISEMFQSVLGGSGSSSLPVTYPKYALMRSHVERFLKLLTALQESALMTRFPEMRDHLVAYTAALKTQLAASFNAPDFALHLPALSGVAAAAGWTAADYARLPEAVVAEFEATFKTVKSCSLVNTILVACKNLIVHKKSIGDKAALRDKFLRDAGMQFAPLPDLPQLNFKRIYGESAAGEREFVLVVLHKLLTISHDVYDALSAPDVDVDEFVEVIMSSIEEVKKHIPRCDQAFSKIVESVGLLRGNFTSYYKDFSASGNPSVMMENFVLDVSKSTNASPQVTAQFRRIISHYRKLASQQSQNPKLQSLFAQVDANFQELERVSGEAGDAGAEAAAAIAAADAEEAAPSPAAGAGKNALRNRRNREKAKQKKAHPANAGVDAADADADAADADAADADAADADAADADAADADAADADAADGAEALGAEALGAEALDPAADPAEAKSEAV